MLRFFLIVVCFGRLTLLQVLQMLACASGLDSRA
jgi:hypothetical protein